MLASKLASNSKEVLFDAKVMQYSKSV